MMSKINQTHWIGGEDKKLEVQEYLIEHFKTLAKKLSSEKRVSTSGPTGTKRKAADMEDEDDNDNASDDASDDNMDGSKDGSGDENEKAKDKKGMKGQLKKAANKSNEEQSKAKKRKTELSEASTMHSSSGRNAQQTSVLQARFQRKSEALINQTLLALYWVGRGKEAWSRMSFDERQEYVADHVWSSHYDTEGEYVLNGMQSNLKDIVRILARVEVEARETAIEDVSDGDDEQLQNSFGRCIEYIKNFFRFPDRRANSTCELHTCCAMQNWRRIHT
jgi:hypothetical protein